jgi:hypothetical protein
VNLSIQAYPKGYNESNAPSVEMRLEVSTDFDGSSAAVYANRSALTVRASVNTPAQCRELAQQLRGAADALVDWALVREQPRNFAVEVKP